MGRRAEESAAPSDMINACSGEIHLSMWLYVCVCVSMCKYLRDFFYIKKEKIVSVCLCVSDWCGRMICHSQPRWEGRLGEPGPADHALRRSSPCGQHKNVADWTVPAHWHSPSVDSDNACLHPATAAWVSDAGRDGLRGSPVLPRTRLKVLSHQHLCQCSILQ